MEAEKVTTLMPRLHCLKCHAEGPAPCDCGAKIVTVAEARAQRETDAHRLYRQGQTMEQIAKVWCVSVETISQDLKDFDFQETGKSKRPKTETNPRGAGRPRGPASAKPPEPAKPKETKERETPVMDRAMDVVRTMMDRGERPKARKLAVEIGISHVHIEAAITAVKAERKVKADPEIDPSTLSLSMKAKFDAAIRQYKKKLDADHEGRVREEIRLMLEASVLPNYRKWTADADEVIKARKGVLSDRDYKLLLRCLHPDTRLSASTEALTDCYALLVRLKLVLVAEKENPTTAPPLPTLTEMMAERERSRQAHSARSKAAHAKRRAEKGTNGQA